MTENITEPDQAQSVTKRPKPTAKSASPSVFGLLPRALKRLESIKRENPSKLALFRAVYERHATRNQCIKAMCIECCGFDTVAVAECGDRCCPLWRYRPFQKKGT